jgi:hypothetical protein
LAPQRRLAASRVDRVRRTAATNTAVNSARRGGTRHRSARRASSRPCPTVFGLPYGHAHVARSPPGA